MHGGRSGQLKHGRYATIQRKSVREELSRQEQIEQDIMDLAPELHLLRSLTIDFINRYTKFVKALLAWHADEGSKTKPRKVIDIADAGNLLDKISKIVERMHKIRSTGSISLDAFKRVTESMGLIVAKEASRHFKHKADVSAFLQAVETQWGTLALDAKTQFASDLEESDEDNDDAADEGSDGD